MKSKKKIKIKKKSKKDTNETDWLQDTEGDFVNLGKIFDDGGIQSLNENLLALCVDTIKGKNEDEIKIEIDTLDKLFKAKTSDEQKNKITKSLLLLSKKEDVFNISLSISFFFFLLFFFCFLVIFFNFRLFFIWMFCGLI